jgi:hypothetical protein
MSSRERVRTTKGRTIPGGTGPVGLRAWGPDGLRRVVCWIQRLRLQHGSPGLAAAVGISINKINKICDGRQEPTPETARQIAAWSGDSLEVIVKGYAA